MLKPANGKPGAVCLAAVLLTAAPNLSFAECEIISDTIAYFERAEEAIILMQYDDQVVRATDGKIRCNDDPGNERQVCAVEGQGEVLIEGPRGYFIARMTGDAPHELHIYATGDLTCGLQSDFNSN